MTESSRYWYQEPMVWMLVAIPLSSVCVGAAMLWLAVTNEDGLVVDDYYKRGLEINRTLERDAMAVRLNLGANLRFLSATGQVVATLDADEAFIYPDDITFGIYHTVKPEFDRETVLARVSDKVYAGPAPELIPGKWNTTLFDNEWRLSGRIDWPTGSISFNHSAAMSR